MNKTEAIATVIREAATKPIVFTTGYTCRIARSIDDRPNHFYMTGSMGLAATIGFGVALSSSRPVVVVDGDGSLAMNPSCLLTIGAQRELRLLHVVLDDHAYESTGGQAVPGDADFAGLARAAGYLRVSSASTSHDLQQAIRTGLQCGGPAFIYCSVAPSGSAPPPRIDSDLRKIAARFAGYVQQPPR